MNCATCKHSADKRILIDNSGWRIWHVTCRLNPTPVTKRADDVCGQWERKA